MRLAKKIQKKRCKSRDISAVEWLLSELQGYDDCYCDRITRYRHATRLLPFEAQELREHGRLPPCHRSDHPEKKLPASSPSHRKKTKSKKTSQDPFRKALAQALSLAKDPRHVIILSRLYAQTIGAPDVTSQQAQSIDKNRQAGKEAKQQLKDLVYEREREYRAALAAANAVEDDAPDSALSKRLVRAIRRYERARNALNELEANLRRHQHHYPQFK